jgi:MFS family permease
MGIPDHVCGAFFVWSLSPLTALLLEDKVVVGVRDSDTSVAREKSGLGRNFFLLLLASLAVGLAHFVAMLRMNDLGFGAAAISSTGAISGAVTLPLPPLLGWLSDRAGRKRLLALCYLAGTVGLLALAVSVSLWHYWVVISLMNVVVSSVGSVGSAMVTDLVPQGSLGRGMSLFTATTWVGGIIGFAGTGYAIQRLGTTSTFMMGPFLPLIAIVLLIPIRRAERGEGSALHLERYRITPAAPDLAIGGEFNRSEPENVTNGDHHPPDPPGG